MTYKRHDKHGGVSVTYVKRPSAAVCGGCDWHERAASADSAGLRELREHANFHAADAGHRVCMTLTQDVFIEPRVKPPAPDLITQEGS